MDYSDAQIIEVMHRLGVSQPDLLRAQSSQRALDALKARLNPVCLRVDEVEVGDDDLAALFQLATHVVKEIESMQAHPNPRRVKWAVRIRSTSVT